LSLVSAQDQDVEDGNNSMTTGRGGVTASAAPQPALIPRPPSFLVRGPPESVTVSIIIDNSGDFQLCCHTSASSSSNSRVNNEKNDNDEVEDEEERLGAKSKQSQTAKLFADKVL
jgi:hypothetical protein